MAPVECLPLILPRPWGHLRVIFSSTYPPPEGLSNNLVSVLIGGGSGETQGGGRRSNSFAKGMHTSWKAQSFSQSSSFFLLPDPPGVREKQALGQLGKRWLLQTCCLQGDLLFGLDASPQALPDWVSNYKKAVSAKTYLTKNTSLCVIRNPKPGRIF